jgi:hypothetical protein
VAVTSSLRGGPQDDSWYSFLLQTESAPGPCASGRVWNDFVGNRSRNFPTCSLVREPTVILLTYLASVWCIRVDSSLAEVGHSSSVPLSTLALQLLHGNYSKMLRALLVSSVCTHLTVRTC